MIPVIKIAKYLLAKHSSVHFADYDSNKTKISNIANVKEKNTYIYICMNPN